MMGAKLIQCIVPYKWSEKHQDYVRVPLDDAEAWVIELNRRFAGTNVSSEQIADLLAREEWSTVQSIGGY